VAVFGTLCSHPLRPNLRAGSHWGRDGVMALKEGTRLIICLKICFLIEGNEELLRISTGISFAVEGAA